MNRNSVRASFLFLMLALFIGACDLGFLDSQGDVDKRVQQTVAAKATLEAAVKATVEAQAKLAPSPVPPLPVPSPTSLPPSPIPSSTLPPLPAVTNTPARTSTPTATPTISSTATLSAPARRLANGTRIKGDPRGGGGENYITVNNNQALDAVFVLVDNGLKAVVQAAYVRSKESFKLENVQIGECTFYYVLGEDWDSTAAQFTRRAEYHKFTDVMKFERILNPTTSTGTYTYWTMPIIAGTAEPRLPIISANDFPSLK